MHYLTKLIILITVSMMITITLAAENLADEPLKLPLEKALQIAEKESYKALLNKLDLEKLDLDIVKGWFVYLPSVAFTSSYNNKYLDVGKEKEFQLPRDYIAYNDSQVKDNRFNQKITFSQRLFDSSTINWIVKNQNLPLNKEIIKQYFIYSIRYLVRTLYYQILIGEDQKKYYEEILSFYKGLGNVQNGINGILSADNNIQRIEIEKKLVNLKDTVNNQTLTLLTALNLPINKKIILTTRLDEFRINPTDKEKQIETAMNNSLLMKEMLIQQNKYNKDYVMNFMDFIPSLQMNVDSKINNQYRTGLSVNWQGKNIQADLIGEYLIYDYDDYYYVNRLDNKTYQWINESNNDFSINDFNFSLVGKIELDKMAKAGVAVKELKNKLKSNNLWMQDIKNSIRLKMENYINSIGKAGEIAELVLDQHQYYMQKLELLYKGNVVTNAEFISYYESINRSVINNIGIYFSAVNQVYFTYALYLQLIEGKSIDNESIDGYYDGYQGDDNDIYRSMRLRNIQGGF